MSEAVLQITVRSIAGVMCAAIGAFFGALVIAMLFSAADSSELWISFSRLAFVATCSAAASRVGWFGTAGDSKTIVLSRRDVGNGRARRFMDRAYLRRSVLRAHRPVCTQSRHFRCWIFRCRFRLQLAVIDVCGEVNQSTRNITKHAFFGVFHLLGNEFDPLTRSATLCDNILTSFGFGSGKVRC